MTYDNKEDKLTEKEILDAAEALFLEQGFTKTTTAQIAQRAGCNHALVHYYYRSKDKLFNKVFEEKAMLLITSFLNTEEDGSTFQEKLLSKALVHFDFLKENQKLPMFLYNEISMNPDRIKPILDKLKAFPDSIVSKMERELNEEIEKGNIRPLSITELIFTVVGLNIVTFLFLPLMKTMQFLKEEEADTFIDARKEEIQEIILARIKP